MSKVSYVFLALVLIVLLFISAFLGSCRLADQLKSAASASNPAPASSSEPDKSGDEQNQATPDTREENKTTLPDVSFFKDNIVSYQQYSDIMFYSPAADFAFVYPQDRLAISSNPYLKTSLDRLFLSVDIAMPGEDAIPPDFDFSYAPSVKKQNRSGTATTEYIIFSKYGPCDVTFDRSIMFENRQNQVLITLAASSDEIAGSCSKYFTADEKNCGASKKVWDIQKMGEFYNELILAKACGPAMDWYATFDEVSRLLQINEFKGASAGYSRLIDNRIFESSKQDNFIISACYPQFQPAVSESLNDSLNKYIYEDTVLENIQAFKDEIASYGKEQAGSQGEGPAWQYMLTIEYEVISYTDKVISLLFNISPYLGGAHGMTYLKTFNFDLENNTLLELGDIFNPGSDYLAYISGYCRQDLEKQMLAMQTEPDKDWINEGTGPAVLQNYSRFLLGPEGLIIRFEAYQVAPGAAGDFSVLIPYD